MSATKAPSSSSSSSTAMTIIRRKPVVSHVFQDEWHEEYLMHETATGCACMICGSEFTVLMGRMLERHFSIKHNVFDETYPHGSPERRFQVEQLLAKHHKLPSSPPAEEIVRSDEVSLASATARIERIALARSRGAEEAREEAQFIGTMLLECAEEVMHEGEVKRRFVQALGQVTLADLGTSAPTKSPEPAKAAPAPAPGLTTPEVTEPPRAVPRDQQRIDAGGPLTGATDCRWYSLMMAERWDSRRRSTRLVVWVRFVEPTSTSQTPRQQHAQVEERYLHTLTVCAESTSCADLVRELRDRLAHARLVPGKLVAVTLDRDWTSRDEFLREFEADTRLQKVSRYGCAVSGAMRCVRPLAMESVSRTVGSVIEHLEEAKALLKVYRNLVEAATRCRHEDRGFGRMADQVEWFRYRKLLPEFLDAVPHLVALTRNRPQDWSELQDRDWLRDLAFLADFAGEFDGLLVALREPNLAVWEHVSLLQSFRDKLEIWRLAFRENRASLSFPRLRHALATETEDAGHQSTTSPSLAVYGQRLLLVRKELDATLAEYGGVRAFLQFSCDMFHPPKKNRDELVLALRAEATIEAVGLFNEIVALSNDPRLYLVAKCGGDVWSKLQAYPSVNAVYQRLLSVFGTTYLGTSKTLAALEET